MKVNINLQVDIDNGYLTNLIYSALHDYVKTDKFKEDLEKNMGRAISDIFENKMFDDTIDKIQAGIIDPFIEKVVNKINDGLNDNE